MLGVIQCIRMRSVEIRSNFFSNPISDNRPFCITSENSLNSSANNGCNSTIQFITNLIMNEIYRQWYYCGSVFSTNLKKQSNGLLTIRTTVHHPFFSRRRGAALALVEASFNRACNLSSSSLNSPCPLFRRFGHPTYLRSLSQFRDLPGRSRSRNPVIYRLTAISIRFIEV